MPFEPAKGMEKTVFIGNVQSKIWNLIMCTVKKLVEKIDVSIVSH
jgi:hypothetical protein